MNKYIEKMIEHLADKRDIHKTAIKRQSELWSNYRTDTPPILLHTQEPEDFKGFPKAFDYEEIQFDNEKMLYNGLKSAITTAGDSVPSIRANKGCGIYPSLLSVNSTYFKDKMPWVLRHLSKKQLSVIEPDQIQPSDEFKRGLETMVYMADALKGTDCKLYPLDLQGPIDTAHIVYGDDFFYDLYDDPAFIHHLLNLSTQAIIKGCEQVVSLLESTGNTRSGNFQFIAHYNNLIMPLEKGGIKFSEDTTTLLNPDQIDEYAIPYLQQLLNRFNGGYVHYCGKNNHLYRRVMETDNVYGINFGNPEMHDMKAVLTDCAVCDKIYYGNLNQAFSYDDIYDYFYKCLKYSKNGPISHILLVHSCQLNELESISVAWKTAADNVARCE